MLSFRYSESFLYSLTSVEYYANGTGFNAFIDITPLNPHSNEVRNKRIILDLGKVRHREVK